MLSKILSTAKDLVPHSVKTVLKSTYILNFGYGHFRSARKWQSTDRDGNPIPWLTYPSIDYLEQIDLSNKVIFEYGSGFSTLYWCSRAKRVLSVEDDRKWFQKISDRIPSNGEVLLKEDRADYIKAISNYDGLFDIIVIDGAYRSDCCKPALQQLKQGGVIIFDNSWNHPGGCESLRDAGLIEVDMIGFTPIASNTNVTSFFFHRDFQSTPNHKHQPVIPVGGALDCGQLAWK